MYAWKSVKLYGGAIELYTYILSLGILAPSIYPERGIIHIVPQTLLVLGRCSAIHFVVLLLLLRCDCRPLRFSVSFFHLLQMAIVCGARLYVL